MWSCFSQILQFRKQSKYTYITCISYEIYTENKAMLCSKLLFKRLLLRLTPGNAFMINLTFLKQVDGCTMNGAFCVMFSNVCLT